MYFNILTSALSCPYKLNSLNPGHIIFKKSKSNKTSIKSFSQAAMEFKLVLGN